MIAVVYLIFICSCFQLVYSNPTNDAPVNSVKPLINIVRPQQAEEETTLKNPTGNTIEPPSISQLNNGDVSNEETRKFMLAVAAQMAEMQELAKIWIAASIGSEKYNELKKDIDKEITEESKPNERTRRISIATPEQECLMIEEYAAYKFRLFSNIENVKTNSCVSDLLSTMSESCATLFIQNSSEQMNVKYRIAAQLYNCYFRTECTHSKASEIISCIDKSTSNVQLLFDQYLSEVKPLCCYFKIQNGTFNSTAQALQYLLTVKLPHILESGFNKVKDMYLAILAIPKESCEKYWLLEFALSQTTMFCYNEDNFISYQIFMSISLFIVFCLIGYVKDSLLEQQISLGKVSAPSTFETPYHVFVVPVVLLVLIECLLHFLCSVFKVSNNYQHFAVIIIRYDTLLNILIESRPSLSLLSNFPSLIKFFFVGLWEWLKEKLDQKGTVRHQAVKDTIARWGATPVPLENLDATPSRLTRSRHR